MRVEVNMDTEEKFVVSSWFAKSPGFVVYALTKQLAPASAVWSELKNVRIVQESAGDVLMRASEEAK